MCYASGYKDAYGQYQEELKKLSPIDPASYASYEDFLSAKSYDGKYLLDPDDEFGGTVTYNNGSVSNGNIMAMQRALGLEDNAMWSVKEKKLTNMTANEAWDAYQRGALQNFKSVSRTPISNSETTIRAGSVYSGFDAGDWEGYFAAIRQQEGVAAAEEELKYLNSQGYIPKNMVSYAALGARGGASGH